MPVYLIRAGEDGPVKIGHAAAKCLAARLGTIQSDNASRIHVLRILVGDKSDERVLHRQFSAARIHGEWFAFDEAILGDVGLPDCREFSHLLGPRPFFHESTERISAVIRAGQIRSWTDPDKRAARVAGMRQAREWAKQREATGDGASSRVAA